VSAPADGASLPDNAPNQVQLLASAGTAVAPSTTATGPATPSAPQNGPDMAALVDRLVEARAAARSGLGTQSVQAAITHADFGKVSLRFDQNDDGMSVSMASNDPAFAPAARAAMAQASTVSAAGSSAQGNATGQQSSGQQHNQQQSQLQGWAQNSSRGADANASGSSGQQQGQNGQQGNPAGQGRPAPQASTTKRAKDDTTVQSRGGILA
jgi:hypothetical protein